MAPAGSLYATVEDLARFLSVLFAGGLGPRGRVLRPETLEQMWTPQFAGPGAKAGYGIGFRVGQLEGHRSVGHGGAIYGFATSLAALPDAKLGAVAVTNVDAANAVTERVVREALRLLLAARAGAPLPDLAATEPVPADLARKLEGSLRRRGDGSDRPRRTRRRALDAVPVGRGAAEPPQVGRDARHRRPARVWNARRRRAERDPPRRRVARPCRRVSSRRRRAAWKELLGEYGWDHNILYVLETGRPARGAHRVVRVRPADGGLPRRLPVSRREPLPRRDADVPARRRGPCHGGARGRRPLSAPRRRHGGGRRRSRSSRSARWRSCAPRRSRPRAPKQAADLLPPRPGGARRGSIRRSASTSATRRRTTSWAFPSTREPRAFLQRPAAEALARANRKLEAVGIRPAHPRRVPALVRHEDVLGRHAGGQAHLRRGPGHGLPAQPRLRRGPDALRPRRPERRPS